MKQLTIFLICLITGPVFAQKSYRNALNKELSIQSKSVADFYKKNDAKNGNSLSKTINLYYWDQDAQDWYLNKIANVKYLNNGDTEEVIDLDALGQVISKTNYYKSADGKVLGSIQYNFIDGTWIEIAKMETAFNDRNEEIRSEYFGWENGNWTIVSGSKLVSEKKTPSEEISIQYIFNETIKHYEPFRRTISTYNNFVIEQNVFQEYKQNEWVNVSAEGYDYDHQQKISSVYYMVWDGVTFHNKELYTNIIWNDYVLGKYAEMELKIWDGSAWQNSQKSIYQYNINHQIIGINFEYINNDWVYTYRISEEYDINNNPKSYKVENYISQRWNLSIESRIEYTYDVQNRLIESITRINDGIEWHNITKETIIYNASSTGFNETKLSINVYPNPSTHYFMVETKSNRAAEIKLYALNGQLINVISTSDLSAEKVDVSNLQKGLYIIEIKQDATIYRSKVLIK